MSIGAYLVVFAVSAAALAVWTDVRFPQLGPGSMRAALLHTGVAMAIGQLVVPAAMHAVTGTGSRLLVVVAIAGVGLPALTYTLLAVLWVMKVLRDAVGGARRL